MSTPDPDPDPEAILARLLHDPVERADPYPAYEALRSIAPVHHTALGNAWLLSRHADCAAALRDPRLGKGVTSADDLASIVGAVPLPEVMRSGSLVHMNPPDHTRLRGLVNRAFTARRVAALRHGIEAHVDALLAAALDRAAGGEQVDLLDELAFPLPVRVIGELVGVPVGDHAMFRQLVRAQALAFEPGADAAAMVAARRGATEMAAYFAALVRARRREPADDLVSALLDIRDEHGEGLSKQELVGIPVLLFGAGFETTMNLIGNTLASLLWAPHDRRPKGSSGDPEGAALLVEEVLRFDSPVQIDARVALEPAVVAGVDLLPGDWIVAMLGAANRDPAAYGPTAGQFDARRFADPRTVPVLSFSAGIHHCLGAPLARLEAAVVVERLVAGDAVFAPVDPAPAWRRTLTSRGLAHLRVTSAKMAR